MCVEWYDQPNYKHNCHQSNQINHQGAHFAIILHVTIIIEKLQFTIIHCSLFNPSLQRSVWKNLDKVYVHGIAIGIHNLAKLLPAFSYFQDLHLFTYGDRSICMFMFGDYKHLCEMYGITGASGRHCCLFCNIPYAQTKLPKNQRATYTKRTCAGLDK